MVWSFAVSACVALLVATLLTLPASSQSSGTDADVSENLTVEMRLPGANDDPLLALRENGRYEWIVTKRDGNVVHYSPDEFADYFYRSHANSPWWATVLNVTSPLGIVWVVIGMIGQLLFTGRMLVQWLVSEKNKKSIVPTAFWWMSLVGASMLLTYFIWRKDIVGIFGQATGWMIYIRNLWMIYRDKRIAKMVAVESTDVPSE